MREMQPTPTVGTVPPYEVTCWERGAAGAGHEHVLAIRTRDPDGGETRWATLEVIAAVRDGETFVVAEDASVQPSVCPGCASVTLVVAGSSELPPCR
jgi:hypothetical protein